MVCKELVERKDYLNGESIETIYFGGGTPSQLSLSQIGKILKTIYIIYNVREDAEITLEGNPDDMTVDFLQQIRQLGINRLSMGVQSFDDKRLKFIHRRHSSEQTRKAICNAVDAGFTNISIDLMFGFPGQTLDDWKTDVIEALKLPVKHISAYSLMYEEGTLLNRMLENGEIEELDEELSLQMFKCLVESLADAGFEQYEISNFSRKGYRSRHNSSYWHGIPYLGVGAGAHSYDGESRQYNPNSLTDYLDGVGPEKEKLTLNDRYNEYVFTSLRTCDGLDLDELKIKFGADYYRYCIENAQKHIDNGRLVLNKREKSFLVLTKDGIFVSNDVMSDLMMV